MPKIDPEKAPSGSGSRYPAPFDEPCRGRSWRRLGEAAGLSQFGVNLVNDEGEEILRAGDCAGFPAGDRNGHCLQNRPSRDAKFLVVGSRSDQDHGEYSDIDMVFMPGRYSGGGGYRRKDGTPY